MQSLQQLSILQVSFAVTASKRNQTLHQALETTNLLGVKRLLLPNCRQDLLDAMEGDMTFAELTSICERREKTREELRKRRRRMRFVPASDPEIQRLRKELRTSKKELRQCYQQVKRMIDKGYRLRKNGN